MKKWLLCVTVLLNALPAWATVAPTHIWNLPSNLDQQNTKIEFSVDTTWHTVEGVPKLLAGEAHLLNPKDFKSVQLRLNIPVAELDTDSSSRDKAMRDAMNEDQFPSIQFNLTSVGDDLCNPDSLSDGQSCAFHAYGDITIRDTTKPLSLTTLVTRVQNSYSIEGTTELDWSNFGIKDPSIFIARVHKKVSIKFRVDLKSMLS